MIEVFADLWCPFAYVGLEIVREQRDALAPDVMVRVRAWPLELVNNAPMNVEKTAHHVHDLREQLATKLFSGFNEASFPSTTLPALALVNAGYRAGVGEDVDRRVRAALWEDGTDIGDPNEVRSLAAEFELSIDAADTAAVFANVEDGQSRGVKGSPHFFCGDRDEFCPSLSLRRDDEGALMSRPIQRGCSSFFRSVSVDRDSFVCSCDQRRRD